MMFTGWPWLGWLTATTGGHRRIATWRPMMLVTATTKVLSVPTGDLGALLVGVGAVLLLIDAVSGGGGLSGMTIRGTLATPDRRLSAGTEIAGSLLVAVGSGLLLFASHGLTVLVVGIVIVVAVAMIYVVMTARLHAHMKLLAQEGNEDTRSWAWCFRHPLWRPPHDS
jgi:hypothetical protein